MITRRMILTSQFALGSILVSSAAFAAPSRAMRLFDTDNDGTIDLNEARTQPQRYSINSTETTTGPWIGANCAAG
jgi:hypothetical protein